MENIELGELRYDIDNLDNQLILLLAERFRLTEKVGIYKTKNNLDVKDNKRELEQFNRIKDLSLKYGLNPDYATIIYECIINTVISRHKELKRNIIDDSNSI